MPKRDDAPAGAPCWIDLSTSDAEASRAFYGELFGWESEDAGPDYGGYINFSKDGAKVAGAMAKQSPEQPETWGVYLAVDDADATAAAEAHGGQVLAPVMDVMDLGRMAFLTDVGGAALSQTQTRACGGRDGAPRRRLWVGALCCLGHSPTGVCPGPGGEPAQQSFGSSSFTAERTASPSPNGVPGAGRWATTIQFESRSWLRPAPDASSLNDKKMPVSDWMRSWAAWRFRQTTSGIAA